MQKPSQKPHHITIAGRLGSGKSTTAKLLAEQTGYAHSYMGLHMGELAAGQGISVEEFHERMHTNPELDQLIDQQQQAFIEANPKVVAEGHTAFHLAPTSFKVFLNLDPELAAQRIHNQIQESSPQDAVVPTVDEIRASLDERIAHNIARWHKLYGFDYLDLSNYDLVIDTASKTPDQVVAEIVAKFEEWLKYDE